MGATHSPSLTHRTGPMRCTVQSTSSESVQGNMEKKTRLSTSAANLKPATNTTRGEELVEKKSAGADRPVAKRPCGFLASPLPLGEAAQGHHAMLNPIYYQNKSPSFLLTDVSAEERQVVVKPLL
jgi:hypothetical protein